MKKKGKTWIEKMGMEPFVPLNKTVCMRRVRFLEKNLKAGRYRGELKTQAKYYKNWYGWFAEQDCIRPAS